MYVYSLRILIKNDFFSLQDKYMRALAETENVRQRMTKQVSDVRLFGIQGFCKDLLEVADILQQATQSVPEKELQENKHLRDLYDGLVMTEAQLQKVFLKHGLEQIIPQKGDKFDPHYHEALFQVPAEDAKMASNVATVEKLGYKLHDRTLRPALVGVFKSWWHHWTNFIVMSSFSVYMYSHEDLPVTSF